MQLCRQLDFWLTEKLARGLIATANTPWVKFSKQLSCRQCTEMHKSPTQQIAFCVPGKVACLCNRRIRRQGREQAGAPARPSPTRPCSPSLQEISLPHATCPSAAAPPAPMHAFRYILIEAHGSLHRDLGPFQTRLHPCVSNSTCYWPSSKLG